MAGAVIDCSPMSEVSTASTTAHTEENHVDESPRGIAVMVVVGVLVGLLSGLFGIGGGTIIVPALVWLGLTQRHAAATSMLAIVPTSVSGVLAYAVEGNVDWIAALLMFLGMFIGGQIGSLLLSRLPEVVLRWAFVVFMAFIIASQLIFIPSRDSSIEFNLVTVLLMIVFGVLAGILAGLLGVGGGAICVPALSILFWRVRFDRAWYFAVVHVPECHDHHRGQCAPQNGACQSRSDYRHRGGTDRTAGHLDCRGHEPACRRNTLRNLSDGSADSQHLGSPQSHTEIAIPNLAPLREGSQGN